MLRMGAGDTASCCGVTCMHRTTAALLYIYSAVIVLAACAQATGKGQVPPAPRLEQHCEPAQGAVHSVDCMKAFHSQGMPSSAFQPAPMLWPHPDRKVAHARRHCVSMGCLVLR